MEDEHLLALLHDAVRRASCGGDGVTLLFSGGLDSSLLAWIAQTQGIDVHLLTVALPGGSDAERARTSATRMGRTVEVVTLDGEKVLGRGREIRTAHPSLALNDLSVQTALSLALDVCPTEQVWCGQGADELFVGYAHSRVLDGDSLVERCERDLQKLREIDLPLSEELSARAGKSLASPYLDPAFAGAVSHLEWTERSGGGAGKPLLRELARRAGLPPEVAALPKKAFQYGSGVHRLLRNQLA